MVYLPTFTIKINQMWVNIPYMEHMGIGNTSYKGPLTSEGCVKLGCSPRRVLSRRSAGTEIRWWWRRTNSIGRFSILTWPMAKRLKLFGITYLVGKISRSNFFSGSRTAK